MRKKYKKMSPSRQRYEQTHRVRSFRTSEEIDTRLRIVKQKEKKSVTDVIKIGLGLLEVKIKAEDEIKQEAFDEGWEDGINRAAEVYEVSYRCGNCGKEIVVTSDEEKKFISERMHEYGWCHSDCSNPGV